MSNTFPSLVDSRTYCTNLSKHVDTHSVEISIIDAQD